jgi:pentatricopeptide repeat protein
VLAEHARDEEAEWTLQCMNNSSRSVESITPKANAHCWGMVVRALCAKGRLTEGWEMLQVHHNPEIFVNLS